MHSTLLLFLLTLTLFGLQCEGCGCPQQGGPGSSYPPIRQGVKQYQPYNVRARFDPYREGGIIVIEWNDSSVNKDGYAVLRCQVNCINQSNQCLEQSFAWLTDQYFSGTSFHDRIFVPGVTYWYMVKNRYNGRWMNSTNCYQFTAPYR
ncbi:MAG TPA: hypothetical protein VF723_01200 [Pyrinomonadaceae bacterium]|jgi:hypothetical protein